MFTRRALLTGLAAAAVSCGKRSAEPGPAATSAPMPTTDSTAARLPSASAPPPSPPANSVPHDTRAPTQVRTRTIDLATVEGGPQRAMLVVPDGGAVGARFPLLVALGGLGETRRGIEAGASAWVSEYWLDRAMKRLWAPPLRSADFQGLVTPARLAAINASLAAQPFRGVVVACPFTPDLWTTPSLDNGGPFARFVSGRLLPRVRAEAPVLATRDATGIDGVSLGGRVALLAAIDQPDAFGAVGVMQGAFVPGEITELARRTAEAASRGGFRLRVLTSEHDVYRAVIRDLHQALIARGTAHEHLDLPGPHAVRWNRGPGALEMLLWHDRVLRGEAPLL